MTGDHNAGIRHGKGAIALSVIWGRGAIALSDNKGDRALTSLRRCRQTD
ncbi:hypothetical protein [Microcoleus sp. herbarium14]